MLVGELAIVVHDKLPSVPIAVLSETLISLIETLDQDAPYQPSPGNETVPTEEPALSQFTLNRSVQIALDLRN